MYECKMWALIAKGHKLHVFQNKVNRKVL